jgi:hypothetical protein
MNVVQIYVDDQHIDDEVIYTDEELEAIFRDYQEAICKKAEFKMWCKEFLK